MIHTNQNIYYSLYAIKHSLSLSVIAALLTKRLTRRMTDMVSSNDMGASFFKFHFELWKYARFVGSTCFLSSVSLFEPTQRFFSLLLFLCKRKPLFAKKKQTNKTNKHSRQCSRFCFVFARLSSYLLLLLLLLPCVVRWLLRR